MQREVVEEEASWKTTTTNSCFSIAKQIKTVSVGGQYLSICVSLSNHTWNLRAAVAMEMSLCFNDSIQTSIQAALYTKIHGTIHERKRSLAARRGLVSTFMGENLPLFYF